VSRFKAVEETERLSQPERELVYRIDNHKAGINEKKTHLVIQMQILTL
jgi:hypothetical protein